MENPYLYMDVEGQRFYTSKDDEMAIAYKYMHNDGANYDHDDAVAFYGSSEYRQMTSEYEAFESSPEYSQVTSQYLAELEEDNYMDDTSYQEQDDSNNQSFNDYGVVSVEVPVEVVVEKQVSVEVPVEVIKEVTVEKEVIREISVEVPVEVVVEKEVVDSLDQEKVELLGEIVNELKALKISQDRPIEAFVTKPVPIIYA